MPTVRALFAGSIEFTVSVQTYFPDHSSSNSPRLPEGQQRSALTSNANSVQLSRMAKIRQ
nr:hypothetical protein [uncultured Pseudodesulfovibrio sp.]